MKALGGTIEFDLFCDWEGEPPSYRLYINDCLFAERTFRYKNNQYLHEVVPIFAIPGEYYIIVEPLDEAEFRMRKLEATSGPMKIIGDNKFEVCHAG